MTTIKRSPIALAVLAMLIEEPLHPYRMQRLIKELADSVNSRSDLAITRVLSQIQKLADANILPPKFHEGIRKIRDNADKVLQYVAHEYLNEHWQPVYHADVARAFAGAKMTYAASAELLKNFYNLALTEAQRELLRQESPLRAIRFSECNP